MQELKKSEHLNLEIFKKSSVGTSIISSECEVKYSYSFLGWFFLTILGATMMPRRIQFQCKVTGEIFEDLTRSDLEPIQKLNA